MTVNFKPTVRMQILSENSIVKIHNAALEILERTDVAINTEEGLKILLDDILKAI